jgi:hypothetical protein
LLPTGVKRLPVHVKAGHARPVSTKDPDSARLNARLVNLLLKVTKAATRAETDDVPLTVDQLRAPQAGPKPRPLPWRW